MASLPQRTLGRTDISVSALGLGTAEMGYAYGIGPRDVPDEDSALALLRRAVELGVTFIDTARFYGVAEERIGRSGLSKLPGITIATKCGHALDRDEHVSDAELARAFVAEVDESLRKLGLESIPLLQVHGGTAERIRDGSIIGAVEKIQKSGKARFVGISTRGEEAALAAIESGFFDTLQLAHSILDQRMTEVLTKAAEQRIGIINRSVLLKGALTPAAQHLAPSLAPLKKQAAAAERIAREIGTDLPSLAIRFALSNPHIHTILVGSNKVGHIEAAVRAVREGPLSQDVLATLRTLAISDPTQVDPKQWPTVAGA
jgi:aryl-alcohol dehydrogenase-like predicted oxidoreductase